MAIMDILVDHSFLRHNQHFYERYVEVKRIAARIGERSPRVHLDIPTPVRSDCSTTWGIPNLRTLERLETVDKCCNNQSRYT
jgi:hypothetical protein